MSHSSRTVVLNGGSETVLTSHPVSIERIKMRGEDGKTAFEVHELRYHPGGAPARPAPTRRPARSTRAEVAAWIERRPVAVVASMFVAVLLVSAAATALLLLAR